MTVAAPRSGIIGTGFMGTVHARAVRAAGGTVVALAGRDRAKTEAIAAAMNVPRALSAEELIADPEVDVVHICTPNAQHVELAAAAIAAGKHVICEKPLALTEGEAAELERAARAAGVVHAVPFVYRYYPTVREARARLAAGGERIWLLHGHYLQDWLAESSDFNWRVEEGQSRAFADIGVHWCDLVEFATGHRITRLVARTSLLHETRDSGAGEVPVTTEDGVTIMFETDRGASGSAVISQATPGRKNRLWFSIDTDAASYAFDQEHPNELWVGGRAFNAVVPKGAETTSFDSVARYAYLPSGHPQGYQDCFTLFMRDVHESISSGRVEGMPTFADGVRAARLTSAVVASARTESWTAVGEPAPAAMGRIA